MLCLSNWNKTWSPTKASSLTSAQIGFCFLCIVSKPQLIIWNIGYLSFLFPLFKSSTVQAIFLQTSITKAYAQLRPWGSRLLLVLLLTAWQREPLTLNIMERWEQVGILTCWLLCIPRIKFSESIEELFPKYSFCLSSALEGWKQNLLCVCGHTGVHTWTHMPWKLFAAAWSWALGPQGKCRFWSFHFAEKKCFIFESDSKKKLIAAALKSLPFE